MHGPDYLLGQVRRCRRLADEAQTRFVVKAHFFHGFDDLEPVQVLNDPLHLDVASTAHHQDKVAVVLKPERGMMGPPCPASGEAGPMG